MTEQEVHLKDEGTVTIGLPFTGHQAHAAKVQVSEAGPEGVGIPCRGHGHHALVNASGQDEILDRRLTRQ